MQCGFEELAAGGRGGGKPGFQLAAQRQQFVHLRHDAVLECGTCWNAGRS